MHQAAEGFDSCGPLSSPAARGTFQRKQEKLKRTKVQAQLQAAGPAQAGLEKQQEQS